LLLRLVILSFLAAFLNAFWGANRLLLPPPPDPHKRDDDEAEEEEDDGEQESHLILCRGTEKNKDEDEDIILPYVR